MVETFLNEQRFLVARVAKGIDIHPSDQELKEFQKLAKRIDKDRYFTIYGCQDCVKALVKFVYDNEDKLKEPEQLVNFKKKATFPKHEKLSDGSTEGQ